MKGEAFLRVLSDLLPHIQMDSKQGILSQRVAAEEFSAVSLTFHPLVKEAAKDAMPGWQLESESRVGKGCGLPEAAVPPENVPFCHPRFHSSVMDPGLL